MAKKVSLSSGPAPGRIVSGSEPVVHGGSRETAESSRRPDVGSFIAGQHDAIFPIVDATSIEPQDANDGSQDGDQASFEMPSFANGRDMRVRR
jgi:hypothetical protein